MAASPELALLVGDLDRLAGIDRPTLDGVTAEAFGQPDLDALHTAAVGALNRSGLNRIGRLQFGVEYCEKRIPEPGEVERALAWADARSVAFTLVTPFVTDDGASRLEPLFDLLGRRRPESEVVVNDLGVLRRLRERDGGLRPVLGRLLDKTLRDPRTAPYYDRPGAPPAALRALRRSALTQPTYREILAEHGVRRVEIDQVLQGIDLDFAAMGLGASVHVPFGFVTAGRICVSASLAHPADEKFAVGSSCELTCREIAFRLGNERSPFDDRDLALYERGTAVFYPHGERELAAAIGGAAERGVDRIVFAPEIPG